MFLLVSDKRINGGLKRDTCSAAEIRVWVDGNMSADRLGALCQSGNPIVAFLSEVVRTVVESYAVVVDVEIKMCAIIEKVRVDRRGVSVFLNIGEYLTHNALKLPHRLS